MKVWSTVKMLEKFFPSGRMDIGHVLNSIGQCYENQNNKQMALDYYQQALTLYEKLLPPNHSISIKTKNSMRRIIRK